MNEIRYPIYSTHISWLQDIKPGEKIPDSWVDGLPEGKIRNSTGLDIMHRHDPGIQWVEHQTNVWWSNYRKERSKNILNPINIDITVKLRFYETWCLIWFEHWTFDTFQSDEEVLASFEDFVRRMEKANHELSIPKNGYLQPYYCLMGAEDRWRWHGSPEMDRKGERTPPPCRCHFCKERGIVRIGH